LTADRKTTRGSINQSWVKALSHPVRAEALRLMNQRPRSPKEISRELRVSIGTASYHVRELLRFGCVELVDTRTGDGRRGATEHWYRALARAIFTDEDWAEVPESVKASLVGTHFRVTARLLNESVGTGIFEKRPDRHHSIFHGKVDQKGWTDTMALLAETMTQIQEIEAESDERMIESDETPISLAVQLLGFEAATR
jgi:DNA-binding transcriptional ArsR family regulator